MLMYRLLYRYFVIIELQLTTKQRKGVLEMDIYSFINSKDIGEYCRKINYQFNPIEASYLIWRSKRRTLKERHAAWTELIKSTLDIPVPDSEYKSLHEFLNDYMTMENDYLTEFYAESDAVYFSRIYTEQGKYETVPLVSLFNTVNDCLNYVRKTKEYIEESGQNRITNFHIVKAVLNKRRDDMSLHYSAGFEPLRIIAVLSKTDLFHTFCKLCPVVPTPFKEGDMVKIYNDKYHRGMFHSDEWTAYVFDTVGYWDVDEDETVLNLSKNYNAILYSYDEWGQVSYIQIPDSRGYNNEIETWGFKPNYLDLEYYNGELKGRERILTGISSYLKGDISLAFLMNTYRVMNAETEFKNMLFPNGSYGCDKKLLKLGGWTNTDIDLFRQMEYTIFGDYVELLHEED